MLSHLKSLLDGDTLQIDSDEYPDLITALRTATAKEYKLDKEETSFDDLLDALQLARKHFIFESE